MYTYIEIKINTSDGGILKKRTVYLVKSPNKVTDEDLSGYFQLPMGATKDDFIKYISLPEGETIETYKDDLFTWEDFETIELKNKLFIMRESNGVTTLSKVLDTKVTSNECLYNELLNEYKGVEI